MSKALLFAERGVNRTKDLWEKFVNSVISFLKEMYGNYLQFHYKRIYEKDPKKAAYGLYDHVYGNHDDFNIDEPKNLIEKITWLELNSDTSLWTLCADKYRMREYVAQCGLSDYLPKLYGHWDDPKDINFDLLPNEFVLKANNSCGTVIVVEDKSVLDKKKTIKTLNKWLKSKFGYYGAQKHYFSIKPCILAEELLKQSEEEKAFSSSLADYKFYCCSGEPECVYISYNRPSASVIDIDISVLDMNWKAHPEWLVEVKGHHVKAVDIPKPACFEEMVDICRILAKPFPQVRVDMYVVKGHPVIGELTFSSSYGFFTKELYEYLGEKVKIEL